jgi:hypothetical protein
VAWVFLQPGPRPCVGHWTETIEIVPEGNNLSTVSGKDDLLQGACINPLSVDLIDATLYFAGRAYAIPARIKPGEQIPIAANIPKDITRRLQRPRISSQAKSWRLLGIPMTLPTSTVSPSC